MGCSYKYSEYRFYYIILWYEVYQDPGKGKVIDSMITTIPFALILTRYCLLLMFYQFMQTIKQMLGKMYIEGALVSKSRNIALSITFFHKHSVNDSP